MVNKRHRIRFLTGLLLLTGLVSCGHAATTKPAHAAGIFSEQCSSVPSNTYEIYAPAVSTPGQTFPLLVVLDPHGDGKTALGHLLTAAKRFPMVVAASKQVQNNYAGYEASIQQLIDDVRLKYPVGASLYLCGFSGGARMALGYAQHHQVQGLIVSGALADAQTLQQVGCTVYSLTGTDDFNFMETAQYLFQESAIPSNLCIELTASAHGWPDSLTLADAIGFVHWSRQGTRSEAFEQSQLQKIDRLRGRNEYIKSRWLARNLASTAPFNQNKAFADKLSQLSSEPGYAEELRRLATNLQMESGVRETYLQAFETNDASWWANELSKVNRLIQTEPDPFAKDAYRRIKGFWGIACYSLCNRAVANADNQALARYVAVYRVLEPQNPDMERFSALLAH